MKKSYKIFAAVATVLLVAGCALVPRVKTGAFEQKADQKQNAAAKAEDAHADLTNSTRATERKRIPAWPDSTAVRWKSTISAFLI